MDHSIAFTLAAGNDEFRRMPVEDGALIVGDLVEHYRAGPARFRFDGWTLADPCDEYMDAYPSLVRRVRVLRMASEREG